KFVVPPASQPLISRPRLTNLLNKGLTRLLTLVSAPAGFGKTTLLAAWSQSLPPRDPLAAWVSLDEEDNDPRLFWTYVLTALNMQQPGHFTPLLKSFQTSEAPAFKNVLTELMNLLTKSPEH